MPLGERKRRGLLVFSLRGGEEDGAGAEELHEVFSGGAGGDAALAGAPDVGGGEQDLEGDTGGEDEGWVVFGAVKGLGEQAGERALLVAEIVPQAGAGDGRLAEDGADEQGVFGGLVFDGEDGEDGLGHGALDCLLDRYHGRLGDALREDFGELGSVRGEAGEDDEVFAGEVAIEGRGAEIGCLGDRLHGGLFIAALREEGHCLLDDAVAAALRFLLPEAHLSNLSQKEVYVY